MNLDPQLPSRRNPPRPANPHGMLWLRAAGWTLVIGVSLRQGAPLLHQGALELASEEVQP